MQEIYQNIYLPLTGPDWKHGGLMGVPLEASAHCDSLPFPGNPRMVLPRANHPGQYLIKACFKYGSKFVELVFSQFSGLIENRKLMSLVNLKQRKKNFQRNGSFFAGSIKMRHHRRKERTFGRRKKDTDIMEILENYSRKRRSPELGVGSSSATLLLLS